MYNYIEAMKEDIRNYINNDLEEELADDLDDAEEQLYDLLWIEDGVTGNGSGSYTFNRAEAREYVTDNMDILEEALREFCVAADTIASRFCADDWEYFDVTIRCYLLGTAISEVLRTI